MLPKISYESYYIYRIKTNDHTSLNYGQSMHLVRLAAHTKRGNAKDDFGGARPLIAVGLCVHL